MMRFAFSGGDSSEATGFADAARRIADLSFTVVAHHDAVSRHRAADLLSAGLTVSSLTAALDRYAGEFDALLVQGKSPAWPDDVCAAATAGKHILLSSPLLDSVPDAERIAAACARSGVRLMLGRTARFRPSLIAVRQALETGKLGEPALLRIHAWDAQPMASGGGIGNGDGGAPAGVGGPRRGWPRLMEQLDLAMWIFGGAPQSLYALGRQEVGWPPSEWPRHVQVHLGFGEGRMALISVASEALPEGERYAMVSLIASAGAAYADDFDQTQLVYRSGGARAVRTAEGTAAFSNEFREFAAAIRQDRDPAPGGPAGIRALQLMALTWQALSTGQPIQTKDLHNASPQ